MAKATQQENPEERDPGGQDRTDSGEERGFTYAALLKALGHPLRRHILRVVHGSEARVSPIRIERKLDSSGLSCGTIGTLSHHIRLMADLGVIRYSGKRQVRGAVEHFYVSCVEEVSWLEEVLSETRKTDEEWLRLKRERPAGSKPASEKAG